ncbi:F-box only protein 10-like [Saccoglossus kowalevskii]
MPPKLLKNYEHEHEITLPPELWRLVFHYFSVQELCRCCQVCVLWNELVNSLDNTVWKKRYYSYPEWRHPNWPISPTVDPKSWKQCLKDNYMANKVWCEYWKDTDQSQCLYVFRKRRDRKTLHVGADCEFTSLKDALNNANAFDRIYLHPGTYDEQIMMLTKLPLELVGYGKLGQVVLTASIELQAETARICNVVIKAPWFTSTIIQSTLGHIQIDNCLFEDGNIEIHAPATCHIRFSKFNHSSIELDSLNVSLIENCEFVQSNNSAAISAWGFKFSGAEYGWVYRWLQESVQSIVSQYSIDQLKPQAGTSLLPNYQPDCKDPNNMKSNNSSLVDLNDDAANNHYILYDSDASALSSDSDDSDQESLPDPSVHQLSYLAGQRLTQGKFHDLLRPHVQAESQEETKSTSSVIQNYGKIKEFLEKLRGCVVRNCKIHKCQGGGIMVSCHGNVRLYRNDIHDCSYGIRCIQVSRVSIIWNLIHHCRTSGVFMRLSSEGVIAGNDIYANGEAGIDIRKQADPFIQNNHIRHGKRSGIVVLGGGKGNICDNDIYCNKEAGIYILYKGIPTVRRNRICHGKAAGIAINEQGRGYITDNLISDNQWGGVDIRNGGNPVIKNNWICNGASDGVVIGLEALGTLENNVIHGNFGHGVWIMSSSKPLLHGNQISNNNDAGIAFVAYRDNVGHHGNMDTAGNHGNELEVPEEEDDIDLSPCVKVATIEYNSIYHNAGNGVCIKGSDVLKVEANAIHANCGTGVLIDQLPIATVINNSITCNAGSGIAITENSSIDLHGNGIYDNSKYGVVSRGSGRVVENDIIGNQMAGIQLGRGTTKGFQVTKNRVYSGNDHGITLLSYSCGTIEDNILFSGPYSHQYVHNNSQCVVKNNQVIKCESDTVQELLAIVMRQPLAPVQMPVILIPTSYHHGN